MPNLGCSLPKKIWSDLLDRSFYLGKEMTWPVNVHAFYRTSCGLRINVLKLCAKSKACFLYSFSLPEPIWTYLMWIDNQCVWFTDRLQSPHRYGKPSSMICPTWVNMWMICPTWVNLKSIQMIRQTWMNMKSIRMICSTWVNMKSMWMVCKTCFLCRGRKTKGMLQK